MSLPPIDRLPEETLPLAESLAPEDLSLGEQREIAAKFEDFFSPSTLSAFIQKHPTRFPMAALAAFLNLGDLFSPFLTALLRNGILYELPGKTLQFSRVWLSRRNISGSKR